MTIIEATLSKTFFLTKIIFLHEVQTIDFLLLWFAIVPLASDGMRWWQHTSRDHSMMSICSIHSYRHLYQPKVT